MRLRLIITILLATLVVVFVIQNQQEVELTFLAWRLAMPRALLVFALLAIGVGLGWLWRGGRRHRH